MTVTITSPYRVGLVAGSGVTISGPAVPSITTDDIFNPDSPSQTLTDMLAGISSAKLIGSANVNAHAIANIPVFNVPVGKVAIPTEVVFALTAITGSGDPPVVNLGFTTPFEEIINGLALTGITSVGQLLKIDDFVATASDDGLSYQYIPAGSALTLRVATAATYSAYQMMVFVFGFVTTAPGS